MYLLMNSISSVSVRNVSSSLAAPLYKIFYSLSPHHLHLINSGVNHYHYSVIPLHHIPITWTPSREEYQDTSRTKFLFTFLSEVFGISKQLYVQSSYIKTKGMWLGYFSAANENIWIFGLIQGKPIKRKLSQGKQKTK